MVLAAPLLFESGPLLPLVCSPIIMVDAPEEEQMRRLVSRDGVSEAEAAASIAAQLPRTVKAARSDVLLPNGGGGGGEGAAREAAGRLYALVVGVCSVV